MKKLVSFAVAAVLSLGLVVSQVSASEELENLSDYDYSKFKGKGITINVANWGEYMSVNDNESLDVNKTFEELTGIKVNYKTVATNEELYANYG